jgi:hypothetical protein
MIYILIPTFNNKLIEELIDELIRQIEEYTVKAEIIVLNAGIYKIKKRANNLREILVSPNDFWTESVRIGVDQCEKMGNNFNDFILLLNDDLRISRNYLNEVHELTNKFPNFILGSYCKTVKDFRSMNIEGTDNNNYINKFRVVFESNRLINFRYDRIELFNGRGTIIPKKYFSENKIKVRSLLFPHYLGDLDIAAQALKRKIPWRRCGTLTVYSENNYGSNEIIRNMLKRYFSKRSPSRILSHLTFIIVHRAILR